MSRILIIGSHAEQLLNFRGDLIRFLQSRGHEVLTASPPGQADVDKRFASWNVRRIDLLMERTGVNVVADLRLVAQIRRLLIVEQPDVVLAYTIKPVIYGAIANYTARRCLMAAMITGLGLAFSSAKSLKERLVGGLARTLYQVAMRCTDIVFFQNPDDEEDFRQLGLLSKRHHVERTNGSGVNLDRFSLSPLPTGPLRFLMVSRLLGNKGVREYIRAAARVREIHPEVECHLVGPFDPNPSALTPAEISAACLGGSIVYHGFVRDVRPHLVSSHVYVLPSYREGTPRSVLEALACGRPIITTDTPGCRETVQEGLNGFLIPPAQTEALADAMLRMVDIGPTALAAMAQASYELAKARFDVKSVNRHIAIVLEQELAHTARLRSA